MKLPSASVSSDVAAILSTARGFVGVAAIAAFGCQGAAQPAVQVPPVTITSPAIVAASSAPVATAPCVAPGDAPRGRDEDVDGDGTPDRIAKGYRDVTIYLRKGDCFTLLATIDPNGPVAFVGIVEKEGGGVRDLSIDTWLFHGDRRRTLWAWDGRAYQASGGDEEIPGPHRK